MNRLIEEVVHRIFEVSALKCPPTNPKIFSVSSYETKKTSKLSKWTETI